MEFGHEWFVLLRGLRVKECRENREEDMVAMVKLTLNSTHLFAY